MLIQKIDLIKYTHTIEHTIEMSESLKEKLSWSRFHRKTKLSIGRYSTDVNIVFIKEDSFFIRIHPNVLKELRLDINEIKILVKFDPSQNMLILGPVIAILTEVNQTKPNIFGSIQQFSEEIARLCESKGFFFYVFSLVDYKTKEIEGFVYEEQNWSKKTVPFPDVVHNRLHNRKNESTSLFLDITTDLIEEKIPYFNHRFLNKWEVHQMLARHDHLFPYLPYTELLTNKNELEKFIGKHHHLFIKPVNGSQGKRIFKVCRQNDGFMLDYTTFSGQLVNHYDSFANLFKSLYPKLKKEPFIMQEAIPLFTIDNRPVDFRILCHKSDQQKWRLSSSVARLSGEQQFVANLARGGKLLSTKEALESFLGRKEALHTKKMIHELSLETANLLSSHTEGLFGEFGIDMALDHNGHPWILEVNTKPSKETVEDSSGKIRPSAKSVLDYCYHLSGY
ncbi:YheC/YheD family endospore coat-associated protein [Metabacillus arenae]|uniref:YheC/YheD family protein n=1 Tax=Metabacillus arenae TaxID=2771434 RepID=A0A926NNV5_9BACI|nr:YheC/YheD family protein [Metabacillus arenae]MBD1383363.1 YheC/YheD family protein [Metabacillus arenae]